MNKNAFQISVKQIISLYATHDQDKIIGFS